MLFVALQGDEMTHALNLVLPLKKDAETKAKLKALGEVFPNGIQQKIGEALAKSKLVHFARVLVIGEDYICVLTEYEGPHKEYTEFFREELSDVFAQIFALAEGAPAVNDPQQFWEFSKSCNRRSLGTAEDGATDMEGNPSGWLFSAYQFKTVPEIQTALDIA